MLTPTALTFFTGLSSCSVSAQFASSWPAMQLLLALLLCDFAHSLWPLTVSSSSSSGWPLLHSPHWAMPPPQLQLQLVHQLLPHPSCNDLLYSSWLVGVAPSISFLLRLIVPVHTSATLRARGAALRTEHALALTLAPARAAHTRAHTPAHAHTLALACMCMQCRTHTLGCPRAHTLGAPARHLRACLRGCAQASTRSRSQCWQLALSTC